MTLVRSTDPCQQCGLHPGVFYFYPLCVGCHATEQAVRAERQAQWATERRVMTTNPEPLSDDESAAIEAR